MKQALFCCVLVSVVGLLCFGGVAEDRAQLLADAQGLISEAEGHRAAGRLPDAALAAWAALDLTASLTESDVASRALERQAMEASRDAWSAMPEAALNVLEAAILPEGGASNAKMLRREAQFLEYRARRCETAKDPLKAAEHWRRVSGFAARSVDLYAGAPSETPIVNAFVRAHRAVTFSEKDRAAFETSYWRVFEAVEKRTSKVALKNLYKSIQRRGGQGEKSAALILANGDALLDQGDTAGATLTYLNLDYLFTESAETGMARRNITRILNTLPLAELDAIEGALLGWNASSEKNALWTCRYHRQRARRAQKEGADASAHWAAAVAAAQGFSLDYPESNMNKFVVESFLAGVAEEAALVSDVMVAEAALDTVWEQLGNKPAAKLAISDYWRARGAAEETQKTAVRGSHDPAQNKTAGLQAREAYGKALDTGLALLSEHPEWPGQVHVAGKCLYAAKRLGSSDCLVLYSALDSLTRQKSAASTVAQWAAHYYAGYLTLYQPDIAIDRSHFQTMIDQLEEPFMVTASEEADPEVRSELEMLVGHAYLALKDYEHAREQYQYVLNQYGDTANGTSGLAALSLALVEAREHWQDPAAGIAAYEEFLAGPSFPFNRAHGLYELAFLHEALEDAAAAIQIYEQIIADYPKLPWAAQARERLNIIQGAMKSEDAAS